MFEHQLHDAIALIDFCLHNEQSVLTEQIAIFFAGFRKGNEFDNIFIFIFERRN
jgi:hypothetical protein